MTKSTTSMANNVWAYYEYYADKTANPSEVESLTAIQNGSASPSKNLLKKVTFGSAVSEYVYEYNDKGFVTKSTRQWIYNGIPANQSVNVNTYSCN